MHDKQCKLEKELWHGQFLCFVILSTILCFFVFLTLGRMGGKISQEIWCVTSFDYSYSNIFKCDTYTLIPSCQRDKL